MYGLLGEKLGHSFSKEIHESINDYCYNLIEVSKQNIDLFLKEREFKAINVTIPYKETVIPYLHYIDPKAKEIGAVNTLINVNDKLYGYNTDYLGLKKLVEKNNIDFKNKTEKETDVQKAPKKQNVLYVKLPTIQDQRISVLTRTALLNPGDTKIAVFDTSTGKYHALKDVMITISDKTVSRLKSLFGEDNIVIK